MLLLGRRGFVFSVFLLLKVLGYCVVSVSCEFDAWIGLILNFVSCVLRWVVPVSYTHLRAHETRHDLVCRLLLEKKNAVGKKWPKGHF